MPLNYYIKFITRLSLSLSLYRSPSLAISFSSLSPDIFYVCTGSLLYGYYVVLIIYYNSYVGIYIFCHIHLFGYNWNFYLSLITVNVRNVFDLIPILWRFLPVEQQKTVYRRLRKYQKIFLRLLIPFI